MDAKKRVKCVVLFLFLVVFLVMVVGVTETGTEPSGSEGTTAAPALEEEPEPTKFTSLYLACDGCDDVNCEEIDELDNEDEINAIKCSTTRTTLVESFDPDADIACKFFQEGQSLTTILTESEDEEECLNEINVFTEAQNPGPQGCWVFAQEVDESNECGYRMVKPGFKFTWEKEEVKRFECLFNDNICGDSWTGDGNDPIVGLEQWTSTLSPSEASLADDSDADPECMLNLYSESFAATTQGYRWQSNFPGEHICSDEHYWVQCYEEDVSNGVTVHADNKLYKCVKNEDDKLPTWQSLGEDKDGDGYASITGDVPDGVPTDCADDPTATARTPVEDCPDVKAGETCEYPAHSNCAACIHPDAPEVCGDKSLEGNDIDNDCNAATSNDCHKFKEGCEKTQSVDEESNPFGATHNNIYGEPFSWISTGEDTGYCCGFNGVETDLGIVQSGKTNPDDGEDQKFLCLNKNTDLVGYATASTGDSEEGNLVPPGWNINPSCSVESDWCWISAVSSAFNIFTIKKSGDEPYDVVSNGVEWKECRVGEEGTKGIAYNVETSASPIPGAAATANRFYCYQEEEHGAWAECVEVGASSVNGIKGRVQGDSLFALSVRNPDEAAREKFIELVDRADFYGTSSISTAGYNSLEFMLNFPNEIIFPAEVKLVIGRAEEEYINREVLGDVVNKGALEQNRWMHVKVPLPELLGVENFKFRSENNDILVRNVFLSNDDTPRFCSGEINTLLARSEENTSTSVWVEEIDFFQSGLLSGEGLCNLYYGRTTADGTPATGGEAWLASADPAITLPSGRNCCGDDANEYYNGADSENACWNSQVLSVGETAMNVEVKVGYMEEMVEILYPEIEIEIEIGRETRTTAPPAEANEGDAHHVFTRILSQFTESEVNCIASPGTVLCQETYPLSLSTPRQNVYKFITSALPEELKSLKIDISELDDKGKGKLTFSKGENGDTTSSFSRAITLSAEGSGSGSSTNIQGVFSDNIATLYFENSDTGERLDNTINLEDGVVPARISLIAELVGEPQIVDFADVDTSSTDEDISSFEIHGIIDGSGGSSPPGIHAYPLIKKVTSEIVDPTSFTFPCTSHECIFSLPGKPPYTLSNPHPELYDLYFKYADGEVLIPGLTEENPDAKLETNTLFDDSGNPAYGNLIARKVPQQILFVKNALPPENPTDEEIRDAEEAQGFFSCNALSEIESDITALEGLRYTDALITEQSTCTTFHFGSPDTEATPQGFFCAPSVQIPVDGTAPFTVVNSWSSLGIPATDVGYQVTGIPITDVEEDSFVMERDLTLSLPLPEAADVLAHQRIQEAEALPARNLLSNAVFARVGRQLPKWTVRDATGAEITGSDLDRYHLEFDEREFEGSSGELESDPSVRESVTITSQESITANKMDLSAGITLRSDPIAVPADAVLELTNKENCDVTTALLYFTQDGNLATAPTEALRLPIDLGDIAESPTDLGGRIEPISSTGRATTEPSDPSTVPSFVVVEFTGSCMVYKPMLQIVDKETVEYNFIESPEDLNPPRFRSALACCPESYCWNGYACIAPFDEEHYPDSSTYLAEYINNGEDDQRYYRCLDGKWSDLPPKKDWNAERSGFCEEIDQCFVVSSRVAEPTVTGSNRDAAINPEAQTEYDPQEGDPLPKTFFDQQGEPPGRATNFQLPACVKAGDYILDHYCELGNVEDDDLNNDARWTSRTKFLVADLLDVAAGNDYSLYCTTPELTLLDFEDQRSQIYGDSPPTGTTGAPATGPTGTTTATNNVCFPNSEARVKELIPDADNRCINNVCILKNEEGQVLFGTTVNRPISNEQSFLDAFQPQTGEKDSCAEKVSINPQTYQHCLEGDLSTTKYVYVKGEKQIVAFSKEIENLDGIADTGIEEFIDGLLEWITAVLGIEEEPTVEEEFLQQADNFRDVFLLNVEGKQVRAFIERLPDGDTVLLAEYDGFSTPICSYIDHNRLLEEKFKGQIFPGTERVLSCISDGTNYKIKLQVNDEEKRQALFQLWPQLTGKLRVEENS